MNAFKRSNTRLGKTKYAGKKIDLYDEGDSYVDNDQRPTSQLSPSRGTTNELGSTELSIKTSNSPLRLFGHGKNSDSTKVIKSTDHVAKKTLADELSNLTPLKNASKRFNTEISTSISKLLELQSNTRTLSDSCKLKSSRNKNLNRNWPNGADTNVPYYHSSSSRSNSEDSTTSGPLKPHTGGDGRWEAIQLANSRESPLGLSHFRLLKRLGNGDIGSVYLVELRGTSTFFAMKVMDKASLMSRNKLPRAETEREILGLLDHPFLPTLYSHFETEKFYCLVMEYCSGGNLHSLRQRQPNKYFTEQAARFYASEVLLALEYLHMLGIIYRDLKPENVLVRDGGHIMLSDFDLSLRCSVNPTLVKSSSVQVGGLAGRRHSSILDTASPLTNINQIPSSSSSSSSFLPRILPKKKNKTRSSAFGSIDGSNIELVAEPSSARSMSFVGTHEYLAPEIICGEGHGSAVDWWTFGVFLYELLHGSTPFKGPGNRATLFNVVGQPLRFPEAPSVSPAARDLIRGLLVKDPQRRIASKRGATEIKQHPFFDGVNWALVRSAVPPCVPATVDFSVYASKDEARVGKKGLDNGGAGGGGKKTSNDSSYLHFEYF